MKKVAILGSTGSIGTQALEVISSHPEAFSVELLTAQNNSDLLIEQAFKYNPDAVVIGNTDHYQKVKEALAKADIKVYAGEESITQIMSHTAADIVLTALVGYSGLAPTLKAIENGKNIALANKETMVVAGEIVTKLAQEKGVNIYPVDSEHSAIFQCLAGEFHNPVEKIILTASGGPFRGFNARQLSQVSPAQALKHPNWNMGSKITIDSASMMNKGLEVIEAKWLFALNSKQIEVIVHPQSIVHSLVQFKDGSLKAQLGLPDMKLPILYALSYPNRLQTDFARFDFSLYPTLSFEAPDPQTFRNLQLAYTAMERGGNQPCVLNAANEIVVQAFLSGKCGFLQMSDLIEKCMNRIDFIEKPSYEDLINTNQISREYTLSLLN